MRRSSFHSFVVVFVTARRLSTRSRTLLGRLVATAGTNKVICSFCWSTSYALLPNADPLASADPLANPTPASFDSRPPRAIGSLRVFLLLHMQGSTDIHLLHYYH